MDHMVSKITQATKFRVKSMNRRMDVRLHGKNKLSNTLKTTIFSDIHISCSPIILEPKLSMIVAVIQSRA